MKNAAHQSRLLITAGPTHEPIDAVRYIGNRSSGRLGVALADCAAHRGMEVVLLLGPAPALPAHPGVHTERFKTCEDLRTLLRKHVQTEDILVMAAAVADYRPKIDPAFSGGKFRRQNQNLTLELEPTPDLLAEVASNRCPGQFLVGFALEPRAEMLDSARTKLQRKRVDMVVANPLETMDSDRIEATVVEASGRETNTPGLLNKSAFAPWLLDLILAARLPQSGSR